MTKSASPLGPVVSAAHLADGQVPALSEIEFALTVLHNAFQRWMVRGMSAAGVPGLSPIDVLVLHASNHRDREKTLSDICMMYNIEDTHVVAYAMKKLESMKLISTGRRGKEKTVKVTGAGADACRRYREVREGLLASGVKGLAMDEMELSRVAGLLHALSGQYDQAARAAVSL
ncbi:MAG: winged helix DNA-binding protein [Rhizobiaceae bacterium]|nr:winged helix DNA-binding protein [Rhizobiaceae bacterium]